MDSVRSVALGFWIGAGSVGEGDDEAGLSHLIEHMLFRGTANYASLEIDQLFDAMGAEINAGTGKETTSVYSRVLDVNMERAFDVMADMVWRPRFAGEDLENEREVVLEEIAMYEDDPQDKVFDVLGEAVFGGHPLGRAIIGRAPVIRGVQPDALRGFHGARYVPGNIVIAAAGSVDHDRLCKLAAGVLTDRAGAAAPVEPPPPPATPVVTRFARKPTEQVHVCLGGRGVARDDDRRYALRVLDTVLGATSSSRLFQEVRERRGLAYAVYSFTSHYAAAGQVGLYLGTRADNLAESMRVVGAELERFAAEGAGEEELERAKDNVKGRIVLSLESTSARMNRLGSSVLAGLPLLTVDEVLEKVDAVSLDDVRSLSGELFAPDALSAAGIGPDEDAFRAALEPVSPALAAAA
jgi:predicted Zn-dependent peptidase